MSITVMENHNKRDSGDGFSKGNPVGGGKKSPLLPCKEYCNSDYCVSCAYFQQDKGHFGKCKILPNKPKYDGTKKGNSCAVYRLNPRLIDQINNARQFEKIKKVDVRKLIRKGYTETKKEISNRKTLYAEHKETVSEDFKLGLPYAQTSDLGVTPAGYYHHPTHYQIMDYAIVLREKGYSFGDIIEKIEQMFNVKTTHTTIWNWYMKFSFLPDKDKTKIPFKKHPMLFFWYHEDKLPFDTAKMNYENLKGCKHCGSVNFKKNGIRYSDSLIVQRYICKDCNRRFTFRKKEYDNLRHSEIIVQKSISLYKKGLSTRQISQVLKRENNVKVTYTTVISWIKKFVKNPHFQINGAHRPEVNLNISKGMSKFRKSQREQEFPIQIKEKVLELFADGLTMRQISKTIQKENNVKITISQVYDVLQNLLPIKKYAQPFHYLTREKLMVRVK